MNKNYKHWQYQLPLRCKQKSVYWRGWPPTRPLSMVTSSDAKTYRLSTELFWTLFFKTPVKHTNRAVRDWSWVVRMLFRPKENHSALPAFLERAPGSQANNTTATTAITTLRASGWKAIRSNS